MKRLGNHAIVIVRHMGGLLAARVTVGFLRTSPFRERDGHSFLRSTTSLARASLPPQGSSPFHNAAALRAWPRP